MLVSVFLLIGGLYMGPAGVLALVPRLCLIAGLALLVVGVVFYCILKSEYSQKRCGDRIIPQRFSLMS